MFMKQSQVLGLSECPESMLKFFREGPGLSCVLIWIVVINEMV